MRKKLLLLGILMIAALFLLTGCVPGDGTHTVEKPAGFFWGIWHGWMAPISLIIGIFNGKINIYEPINTGWFYNFGFYMAVVSGFGGLSLARKKKKSEH